MAGRESAAVQAAVAQALAGSSNLKAAKDNGVNVSSLKRALRRRNVPPKVMRSPAQPCTPEQSPPVSAASAPGARP